jgi:RNA polymerase sigma-70 factor (ECF subfamily)
MSSFNGSTTSLTLLGRLRASPTDEEAWRAFVARYGARIYSWCSRWGLQEADCQDVTQNVLVELARQMNRFDYRPAGSFRGWLKTIAYRAWCDFLTARSRTVPTNGDSAVLRELGTTAAMDDFLRRLDEECERELLEEAMAHVRLRVQPQTWEAFLLTAIEGKSGAEVAERLKMSVGSVLVARSRVQKHLQEEVRRLESAEASLAAVRGSLDKREN